ncbi:MAG: hypothetical protein JRN15_15815, partial [Nitrososphaerota archaeon]|nr:hypothetical protein [Nitrososphaerota archaeon]
ASGAILLWISPTDQMTGVISAIATVVAVMMLWEFLFTNKVIRLSTLCAIGLTVGYGAGTLNTWLTFPRGGLPLASMIGQTVPELADGVAAALMGCAFLLCIGELIEKPVWTMAQNLRVTGGMKWLVLVNTLIIAVAFAAGKFIQGGVKNAGAHSAGTLAEFLMFLVGPTVVMAGLVFFGSLSRNDKYVFGLILLGLLLFLTTQGRRNLVYPALIIIPVARFSGYKWNRLTASRILLVVLAFAILSVGVLAYQLLRLAGDTISNYSITAEASQAAQWAKEGRAWNIATTSSVQNVQQRTLLVVFMSDLLYQARTQETARGKDLLLQIEWAIPGVIFPNKPTIAEEDLASQTYHLFYPDESNSIFTAGALDFGLWGVLIYPIAVVMLCSFIQRMASAYFSYEVAVFGFILFLLVMIAPEHQLGAYFVAIRNLLAFSGFVYILSKMPSFQFGTSVSGANA